MPLTVRLTPNDPLYPEVLRALVDPPPITVSAPLELPFRAVAIVGSRQPIRDARRYAYALAYDLASRGVTIVSGGAVGIDAAAHRGALDAGGATWVVCGTGRNHVYPPEHVELFETIARTPGSAMIWPFEDDMARARANFLARNKVLVALSQAVVMIQARVQSGSRNAAKWARSERRPLWVVPAAPWDSDAGAFAGSVLELSSGGARLLWSGAELFESLGIVAPSHRTAFHWGRAEGVEVPKPNQAGAEEEELEEKKKRHRSASQRARRAALEASLSEDENAMFSIISASAEHLEQLAGRASLSLPAAITALLTLSLKNVVVEGPSGFFRRKSSG